MTTSLVRDCAVQRRTGDHNHHTEQLSRASNLEKPLQLLLYAIYLSSNNLLGHERTDTILHWISDTGNSWVITVIVALRTPTTDAFAGAILNSAVRLGKNDIACELLEKGVNPNFITHDPVNPFKSLMGAAFSHFTLDEAVKARNIALVRLLVKKGAQSHSQSWEDLLLENNGDCSNDHLGNVQFVIDNGRGVNTAFRTGPMFGIAKRKTLFHTVIENGDVNAAKMFLDAGASVNMISKYFATPLQVAAGLGNVEMVKLLINAGAEVDAPSGASVANLEKEDIEDILTCSLLTPLQIALAGGEKAVAEVLLQHGADVNGLDVTAYCTKWEEEAVDCEEFFPFEEELHETIANGDIPVQFWHDQPYSAYCRFRHIGLLNSPLQAAAARGDLELVDRLLSLGANLQARGGFGTALQVAASRKGNLEVVRLLLDKGANINAAAQAPVGRTALQAAIQCGDVDTVHFLIESGAAVNDYPCLARGRSALQAAVERNDIILARLLILLGAKVNTKASPFGGRTCLQAAAGFGNMQMIDLLLKHGANASAPPSKFSGGTTAIMAAVDGKHIVAARKILDNGGNPNVAISVGDDERRYPLGKSIEMRQHEMTQLLLENGADPNGLIDSQNPLALARSIQEPETMQLLIRSGADVNALSQLWEESVLQAAAKVGSVSQCRLLIEAGAVLEGDMGTAALQSAVQFHHTAVIKYLLSKGVSPNWGTGPRRKVWSRLCSPITAMFEHSMRRDMQDKKVEEEIIDMLLRHGAEIRPDDNLRTRVCHLSLEMIRRLIGEGLNINPCPDSSSQESLLHYASSNGMIDIVRLLLDAGADVNLSSSKHMGRTALHGAVAGQHISVAELLLSSGAHVNGRAGASNDRTVLHEAVIAGSLPLVLLLLKKGADVNAVPSSSWGRTVLEAAAVHGRLDIAHLLLKEDKEPGTLQMRCTKAAELALSNGFPALANVLQEWKVQNAEV